MIWKPIIPFQETIWLWNLDYLRKAGSNFDNDNIILPSSIVGSVTFGDNINNIYMTKGRISYESTTNPAALTGCFQTYRTIVRPSSIDQLKTRLGKPSTTSGWLKEKLSFCFIQWWLIYWQHLTKSALAT